jgi:hypothetical protein
MVLILFKKGTLFQEVIRNIGPARTKQSGTKTTDGASLPK